jgi:hypothetical protein
MQFDDFMPIDGPITTPVEPFEYKNFTFDDGW